MHLPAFRLLKTPTVHSCSEIDVCILGHQKTKFHTPQPSHPTISTYPTHTDRGELVVQIKQKTDLYYFTETSLSVVH